MFLNWFSFVVCLAMATYSMHKKQDGPFFVALAGATINIPFVIMYLIKLFS